MDACARIRGVPLKPRSSIRKESMRESSVPLLKALLKSKKELCSVMLELPARDPPCLTEIHFVSLPSYSEAEDFALQALPSVPLDLLELLRSLHVHSLKNEEMLLLKDSRRVLERKDSISQTVWPKAICVFRHSQDLLGSASTLSGLLTRYMAGMRYALELQILQKGTSDGCQVEDDDTNQSVSSIEDDFVTAFENLEEETPENSSFHSQRSQRDVASQTVLPLSKEKSGSRVIISSFSKKTSVKKAPLPEIESTVQSSQLQWSPGPGSQWSIYKQESLPRESITAASLTESDDSDCSSPSPIIFLDEEGYQKSLRAKLDIPKIPVFKDGVEDSDSEVSEFFDSFDQFDDLDQDLAGTTKLPKDPTLLGQTQGKMFVEDSKCASRGFSSTAMNPHRFDHPTLPANVKKPTPLKPGSLSGVHADLPDTPRPAKTLGEENGPLFSPIRSSAFSPLGECSTLECFWKTGDDSELRKPQDLCRLYKTYSDFANNLSKEILGSVCGYSSPVDMNVNKNLSCVCHKKFKNSSGHLMKLSDIQQTVTISKAQKSQTLKDGIQKFATDLVEMSLGSAFRDLQKGVSSCTTTLCHLAARLTSSVFQMAFHEIGMRHAYVLKERAINGLASFLVGEAVSGALQEFHFVKKQIFNNTVAKFAADLAEELVFEGIMEVCQFSHPSTPLTPSSWSFEQEEVVSSYASDLSESVLQEAFIELSQSDVTFTTQAAISVSLDNIRYVSAEDATEITKTCNATSRYLETPYTPEVIDSTENSCTVRKALFCMSGIASCVPVPVAGKAISQFQSTPDACQYKSSICQTSQTSPKKSTCSEGRLVTTSASETSTSTQTDLLPVVAQSKHVYSERHTPEGAVNFSQSETVAGNQSFIKTNFQNYSGNMVDLIVNEAYEIMTTSKMKKTVEDCADCVSKKIVSHIPTSAQMMSPNVVSGDPNESTSKRATYRGTSNLSSVVEAERLLISKKDRAEVSCLPEVKPGAHFKLQDSCLGSYEKSNKPKGAVCLKKGSLIDQKGTYKDTCESDFKNVCHASECTSEMRPSLMKDTLEVPSFETSMRSGRKAVGDEAFGSSSRKSHGVPGTPPSTPQQPAPVSQEKQFRQFSKKLKGKLAKEFSPATPPSTPRYEPAPDLVEAGTDSEKADFVLKLMRSLSEEALSNEDAEEEQEDHYHLEMQVVDEPEPTLPVESDYKMAGKGAFRYAERLACHIVSMATEMDTLALNDGWKVEDKACKNDHSLSSTQFSEQTLNSLWTYAGEIAGEVINDVKKMINCSQSRHKFFTGIRDGSAESQSHLQVGHKVCKLGSLASHDLVAPISSSQICGSSGLSSKYPSCESVTDEYSGYLIRVLKREGGNRELILDQYASRLAYRSLKSGLAHAARKIKQRSTLKLHPGRRLHHDGICDIWKESMTEAPPIDDDRKIFSPGEVVQCTCQNPDDMSRREYMALVNFAECLAYNITCDVTRKLRLSSVRLPKSLTDSCLYKKSKLDDMTENLIRTTFSCSLLPYTEKTKQYHSTGSLNDGNYSDGVVQVIEHYARKIVDDTLEMTLASANQQAAADKSAGDHNSCAKKLTEVALDSALTDKVCRYCMIRERPFCRSAARHHFQDNLNRRRHMFEAMPDSSRGPRVCGLEIPKIHIDLEKRAAYAEEMVSSAIEKAKRELSSASLNADSGIGHDGASFAESLTAEIMTSAISNVCQTINLSTPGKEGMHPSESTASQQLSLSAGDDSIGSWSNLSFEEEHPDESSSFLHLSDSNGNSSSWSSLGLEGEIYEEHLSFSPSDSDGAEDKETEVKEDSDGAPHVEASLLVVNVDVAGQTLDPQVRAVLQWIAASQSDLPAIQLSPHAELELQLLPAVLRTVRDREWKVGDLLQALLRYCDEPGCNVEPSEERRSPKPLFQWLQEHT